MVHLAEVKMLNQFIRAGLCVTALLLFVVGCGSAQSPAPAATAVLLGTPAPAVSATSPTPPTTNGSTPRTAKDVDPTKVYTFRVIPEQTQASYSVHEILLGRALTT